VCLKADIPGLGGGLLHLPRDGDEPVEDRALRERESDLGQQFQAPRVVGGQERGCTREEVDGGRLSLRAKARSPADARRSAVRSPQRGGSIAGTTELEQNAMRLLEVVGDDSSYSPARSLVFTSIQSARRSCISTLVAFGMPLYALSRTRMCVKRKASSPRISERSGRMSSFRTSDWRHAPTCERMTSGTRADTAPHQNDRPTTEARSMTARCSGSSRSSRAAGGIRMVGKQDGQPKVALEGHQQEGIVECAHNRHRALDEVPCVAIATR
jgi:hypothetical protein